MVIHIVNGSSLENRTFLEFIHKPEQLGGSILPANRQKNGRLPRCASQNLTDRYLRRRRPEKLTGILADPVPIVGKNSALRIKISNAANKLAQIDNRKSEIENRK